MGSKYVQSTIKLGGKTILKDPQKWTPLFGINDIKFIL